MKCELVQELLLTDYRDGELPQRTAERVRRHLKTCTACRDFERLVAEQAMKPFSQVEDPLPPHSVWEQVQERLAGEKRTTIVSVFTVLKNAINTVVEPFRCRRPAFAFVSVAIIAFVIVLRLPFYENTNIAVKNYLGNRIEFLSSLTVPSFETQQDTAVDFGTPIEYFFMS